jgi:hypothetical protein
MRHLVAFLGLTALALGASTCVGTTGSGLVTFDAAAAGPADAVSGEPYTFTTGRGFEVTLTQATIHIGGLYLNHARPISGAQATSCVLPGIYVGEVTQGMDVDVLSPDPQPFPITGAGTETQALVGEVWLNHGDVNAPDDADPVLQIAGVAQKDGVSFRFQGVLTIGENRAVPSTDPALPNQHPICKQRIVSPIDLNLEPTDGGHLLVRIDPRGWFLNVDFSKLDQVSESPPLYQFSDDSEGQPNVNLYNGLHATAGAFQFSWNIH